MSIEKKIHQREKKLKYLYPIAEDNIRKKANAELHLTGYHLHYNFLRFAFSFLSFILYVPTLIELFQHSYISIDYIRNIIILIILILLEIGLAYSLMSYYIRKHSHNQNNRSQKRIAYTLAIISIVLSALSGVNAIDITDNGKENAITQTRTEKKEDIHDYKVILKQNNATIEANNKIIRENNTLIDGLKGIAATKKGNAQIISYQARNKELQAQNEKLITQNSMVRDDINEIRHAGDSLMKDRISHAGKKEWIYMIIFFFAGIIAVAGLMFSYNFIGQYYHDLEKDVEEIEALEDFYAEKQEKEIARRTRKERLAKESELRNKGLDKQLAEADKAHENSSGTWTDEVSEFDERVIEKKK
jgi:hypothetical protein